MDFDIKQLAGPQAALWHMDAVLVLVPDKADTVGGGPLGELIRDVTERGDLEKGVAKCLFCYRPAGFKASRVVLVRAGDGSAAAARKAVAAGLTHLKTPGVKKLGISLSLLEHGSVAVRAAMAAVSDATYSFVTTKPSAKARTLKQVILGVSDLAEARGEFRMGQAQVAGVEMAKEWANRPANHATPSHLADAARKLGRKPRMKTEVLGPKEVKALGMGAFLAVAQGSAEPLRFIVMRYQGGPRGGAPVVLIGKGITFDTGGISIKPAAEMD
jgi:leucyl aminopeptidase